MSSQFNGQSVHDLEEQTLSESDSVDFPPSDVVAYNELRSCADLYRMYRDDILEIHPDFQREIVWRQPAQTRFVDSLVKQLPIPSMCFSLDYKTQKWQVIDGLQRMWTIVRFLRGDKWNLSRIPDVDPAIAGEYVPNFLESNSKLHNYYRRIENFTLPITVIRCDSSKTSHMEYIFTIFHRLNTGAARLTNQEIRNCIFSGTFNSLLNELAQDQRWLLLNKRPSLKSDRYRGQELILRFFAFHDTYREYSGRLAAFLNNYMRIHREPGKDFLASKRELFERTIEVLSESIFEGRPSGRMGLSVMEATLVGVGLNLHNLETRPDHEIRSMYDNLLQSEEFSDDKLREGLSGTQRVLGRMSAAELIFSGQAND